MWRGGQPLHCLRPTRCSAPHPHLLTSAGSIPRVLRTLETEGFGAGSNGLSDSLEIRESLCWSLCTSPPGKVPESHLAHSTPSSSVTELYPSCHCERTLSFSSEKSLLQGEPLLTPEGTARTTRVILTGGRHGSGKAGRQSRSRPCPPSWVTSGQACTHSELHAALCTPT